MTLTKDTWNGNAMHNLAMLKKLSDGKCIDLSGCEKTEDGSFILTPEQAKKVSDPMGDWDLCIAVTEKWVWSVGSHKETGQVLASLNNIFYQNPDYHCLWLR